MVLKKVAYAIGIALFIVLLTIAGLGLLSSKNMFLCVLGLVFLLAAYILWKKE